MALINKLTGEQISEQDIPQEEVPQNEKEDANLRLLSQLLENVLALRRELADFKSFTETSSRKEAEQAQQDEKTLEQTAYERAKNFDDLCERIAKQRLSDLSFELAKLTADFESLYYLYKSEPQFLAA